jgi:hypothetical protein
MSVMADDAGATPAVQRSIIPRIVVPDVEGCAPFLRSWATGDDQMTVTG